MHIHLDLLGGIAGDMFISALLDVFPELSSRIQYLVDGMELIEEPRARITSYNDGIFEGKHFGFDSATDHKHHRKLSDISELIHKSKLDPSVKEHAIDIFSLLADAEATVHGCDPESVHFHEVGATDSILDIVISAWLIDTVKPESWSVNGIPAGEGFINTVHGKMPLPAPAVVKLLEGFPVYADGYAGERVTPTGAAILKHLNPQIGFPKTKMSLYRAGVGYGTRKIPGISNILRIIALEAPGTGMDSTWDTEYIVQIEFDIDDQTAEDLSLAQDRLRQLEGVLDVSQIMAMGKKGRLQHRLNILLMPGSRDRIIEACFNETTTVGLRYGLLERAVLRRKIEYVEQEKISGTVKVVTRPTGRKSAKTDIDSMRDIEGGVGSRELIRKSLENKALDNE